MPVSVSQPRAVDLCCYNVIMGKIDGSNPSRLPVILLALAGGSLVLLCVMCLGGALVLRGRVMPSGNLTRTALVQLFLSTTPFPSGTPVAITPITPAAATEELFPTAGPAPSATIELFPTAGPLPSSTGEPLDWDTPPQGKIVFACFDGKFDQICVMNADGTARRLLTNEQATSFYPSLAPDGKSVVFSSNRDGNFEIYELEIKSKDVTQLTDNLGNAYAPDISPNGQRIVFASESGRKQSVWVMKRDGGNPHLLEDEALNAIDPSWSPDGSQIAFASDRGGVTTLYVMNSDGSNPRTVLKDKLKIGGRSSWSPDGLRLAFYAGERGDREVYVVSLADGRPDRLTERGDNLAPCFSTDGQWLVFTSFRDGNNEIYVYNLATGAIHRLTERLLSDWQPRWGP